MFRYQRGMLYVVVLNRIVWVAAKTFQAGFELEWHPALLVKGEYSMGANGVRVTGKDAQYWIEKLRLSPHPEGGFYRQTYRSELTILREGLPAKFPEDRRASTAIYFLLDGENFSAFHRLRSDEVWHFYAGAPLAVHVIDPDGKYSLTSLGSDPEAGQVFQAVVPAGCWFASHVAQAHPSTKSAGAVGQPSWSLVGCTVAPGFEFEDFELAKRDDLVAAYPQHRSLIERLTRR